jgi:hypothetical protein
MAQALTLALVGAFGPGRLYLRLLLLPVAAIYLAAAIGGSGEIYSDEVGSYAFGLLFGMILTIVPLSLLRILGVRIERAWGASAAERRPIQFSLRRVLVLIFVIAVLLAWFRIFFLDAPLEARATELLTLVCILALLLVSLWGGCGRGPLVVRLLIVFVVALGLGRLLQSFERYSWRNPNFVDAMLLQAFVTLGTFLPVRFLGYRLVWWSKAETAPILESPAIATSDKRVTDQRGDAIELALGLVILAHALAFRLAVEFTEGWGYGLFVLQSTHAGLLGACAVLARGKLLSGILIALLALAANVAALPSIPLLIRAGEVDRDVVQGVVIVGVFLGQLAVLFFVRAAGCAIEWRRGRDSGPRPSVRSALGAAVTGLFLSLMLLAAFQLFQRSQIERRHLFVLWATVSIATVLPLWLALGRRMHALRILAATLVLATLVIESLPWFRGLWVSVQFFLTTLCHSTILAATTLLIFRPFGYRLVWGAGTARVTMGPPDRHHQTPP